MIDNNSNSNPSFWNFDPLVCNMTYKLKTHCGCPSCQSGEASNNEEETEEDIPIRGDIQSLIDRNNEILRLIDNELNG